jgi:hypothetical protein
VPRLHCSADVQSRQRSMCCRAGQSCGRLSNVGVARRRNAGTVRRRLSTLDDVSARLAHRRHVDRSAMLHQRTSTMRRRSRVQRRRSVCAGVRHAHAVCLRRRRRAPLQRAQHGTSLAGTTESGQRADAGHASLADRTTKLVVEQCRGVALVRADACCVAGSQACHDRRWHARRERHRQRSAARQQSMVCRQ